MVDACPVDGVAAPDVDGDLGDVGPVQPQRSRPAQLVGRERAGAPADVAERDGALVGEVRLGHLGADRLEIDRLAVAGREAGVEDDHRDVRAGGDVAGVLRGR